MSLCADWWWLLKCILNLKITVTVGLWVLRFWPRILAVLQIALVGTGNFRMSFTSRWGDGQATFNQYPAQGSQAGGSSSLLAGGLVRKSPYLEFKVRKHLSSCSQAGIPLTGGGVCLLLFRPSPDWVRPTTLGDQSALFSPPVNVNLIQKHSYRHIQDNVTQSSCTRN